MNHFLPIVFLFLSANLTTFGQTEEPIHYKVIEPAGADLTLDGTLTVPDKVKKAVPVVLLIAGSGPTDRDCNSTYGFKTNAFKMLADSLVRQGIAVARYDKRYSGTNLKSAVAAISTDKHRFDYYVSDAVGFIQQLQADKRFSKVIVAGHSEGSLVGMLAAKQTKVAKYISIAGAGRNIADVMKVQFQTALPDTLRSLASVILDSLKEGYRVQRVNPFLQTMFNAKMQPGLISWMKYDPSVEIKKFNGPVLLINGKNDIQVATSEAELLKAARPDATLALINRMNHIFKNAPLDRAENIKTYNNPELPLTPGLVETIAQFVNN
ncbi:lysophospholipase [Spirosoma sp. KCTC 42546]|uniref:alpha/beta hydrolase family protein n=1 Tax=Spirosoma sp. KCTC 42546 TaxID=2520506 RepID=UPI001156FFFD|nr:alpha/beta fold hydrolase [Spirosoma sp. KCTC 42546]QDK80208.1 lysophospholipase [Spirosoma sp. KCTC 42546]